MIGHFQGSIIQISGHRLLAVHDLGDRLGDDKRAESKNLNLWVDLRERSADNKDGSAGPEKLNRL
jgi:hypothetical protein